jgi:hypothetical protein
VAVRDKHLDGWDADALEALVGPEAKGLSASTVSRLKQAWGEEYAVWREGPLGDDQWLHIWVDEI